jgi:hypothetical protein
MLKPGRGPGGVTAGFTVVAAVAAVGCCAALPAIGALLGGLTLGAVLGLGLGAVVLGVLAWTAATTVVHRRRSRCDSGAPRR